VKTTNRRATVTWGLVMLGALGAAAVGCGSPNWQNQYTETPGFTGAAAEAPDSATPAEDGGGSPCRPGAPNCDSILWASPTPGNPPPGDPGNPLGNPDPVPWIDPTEIAQTQK